MVEAPLKVLIVGLSWPPETFLTRLMRGLTDAGIDITIASAQRPGKEWICHPNVHWLHTPSWDRSALERLFWLAWGIFRVVLRSPRDFQLHNSSIRQVKSRIGRLQAWHRLLPFTGERSWDIIYFPWNSAAINHLPLFDIGCPIVISCRGTQINIAPHNPHRSAMRDALSITFQRAAAVHCVSEAIKHEAAQYGLDPRKVRVIRPAVDPSLFQPLNVCRPQDNIFRVVTTGSLVWLKGYEYALTAIRHLLDQGILVDFDIIGDGPERQRILYTIHDLDLADHVHLHGHLNPEQVRDLLSRSDVFLFSSLSEGISNAVLEAMACGLPIVTTDCGGMREAITDGREGFVVPVRDSQALSMALSRLAGDPPLMRRLGQAARERVLQDFRLDQQIEQFITMFRSILDR